MSDTTHDRDGNTLQVSDTVELLYGDDAGRKHRIEDIVLIGGVYHLSMKSPMGDLLITPDRVLKSP